MIHTRIATEYRAGTRTAVVPTIVAAGFAAESGEWRSRLAVEQAMDQTLADSFPASDPPSWTPGIAHPNPVIGLQQPSQRSEAGADAGARTGSSGLSSGGRTFLQGLVSLAGAAGIALLVPFAILLVGLPVGTLHSGCARAVRLALRLQHPISCVQWSDPDLRAFSRRMRIVTSRPRPGAEVPIRRRSAPCGTARLSA